MRTAAVAHHRQRSGSSSACSCPARGRHWGRPTSRPCPCRSSRRKRSTSPPSPPPSSLSSSCWRWAASCWSMTSTCLSTSCRRTPTTTSPGWPHCLSYGVAAAAVAGGGGCCFDCVVVRCSCCWCWSWMASVGYCSLSSCRTNVGWRLTTNCSPLLQLRASQFVDAVAVCCSSNWLCLRRTLAVAAAVADRTA